MLTLPEAEFGSSEGRALKGSNVWMRFAIGGFGGVRTSGFLVPSLLLLLLLLLLLWQVCIERRLGFSGFVG